MQKVNEFANDKNKDGEENPLLKASGSLKDNLKDYRKIMPDMRLYATLDVEIQEALKKFSSAKS